jgi:hypothetical protein
MNLAITRPSFLDRIATDVFGVVVQFVGVGKDLANLVYVNHSFYDGSYRVVVNRAVEKVCKRRVEELRDLLQFISYPMRRDPALDAFLRKYGSFNRLMNSIGELTRPFFQRESAHYRVELEERMVEGWVCPLHTITLFPRERRREILGRCAKQLLREPIKEWKERIDPLSQAVQQLPEDQRGELFILLVAAYSLYFIGAHEHNILGDFIRGALRENPPLLCQGLSDYAEVGDVSHSPFHCVIAAMRRATFNPHFAQLFITSLQLDEPFDEELRNFDSLFQREEAKQHMKRGDFEKARFRAEGIVSEAIREKTLLDIAAFEEASR